MSQEEIEIEISPTGQVTLRTKGIKGPRCVEIGQAIAQIIGRIDSQELTHEYHEGGGTVRRSVDVHERR